VKWLIDAQLPRRLADRLNNLGHDAVHTLDLPRENRTADSELCQFAFAESRIVVSKDRNFLDSYLVTGLPPQLLWVTTGNITNRDLLELFESLLSELPTAFDQASCVELTIDGLLLHG